MIEATNDGVRVKYEVDGLAAPARAIVTPAKGFGKSKTVAQWGDAGGGRANAGVAAL